MARYQDIVAMETLGAAKYLSKLTREMPEERLGWAPLGEGRSALHQVAECAVVADWVANVIERRSTDFLPKDLFGELNKEASSVQDVKEAVSRLIENTGRYVRLVKEFPDEELDNVVPMWTGDQPMWRVLNWHYRNMMYHIGQINYIQTLYGDKEMR